MSFFDRLFAFRQREERAPFEDFLTELLAEWLRQATASGRIAEVLTELFRLRPEQLGAPENLHELSWETQHIIGPGHRAEGKRPDLVGRGPGFFLLVENKIAAAFTQHQDELGDSHQLELYAEYRQERTEPHGGILLLTHVTLPPPGWMHETLYWRSVERYLRHFSDHSPAALPSALDYLTRQLTLFLGENGMSGTRIALEDITAYPAYQRLTEGLYSLGKIAENQLKLALQHVDMQSLRAPRGGGSGAYSSPKFFGWTLTNDGLKPDDAHLILWSGIVAYDIYGYVNPRTPGIPDLSVGVGLWCGAEQVGEADRDFLSALVKQLNDRQHVVEWRLEASDWRDYGHVFLVSARRALIEVHVQAGGDDLDDIASEFFRTQCAALLEVLSAPAADRDMHVESYLRSLTVSQ
ncbi:hypothetical protein KRX52_10845 [Pseudomonas sp. MAP12]|uniref:PD-(D/E)XK nuclease superfamily protein n=1 Tax=Geopseudomonas aromaticivorans TaxID=2849492 RepID=A0ABS6MYG8_9GAMM|nr:hypothetical protein [Pseudomonas aromaticivorans]MBV2133292.1 hypothetical protein [Pseudomonas aromaticivorans]